MASAAEKSKAAKQMGGLQGGQGRPHWQKFEGGKRGHREGVFCLESGNEILTWQFGGQVMAQTSILIHS